ncbi:MAG: hypothetical protein MJ252_29310, partial [archaeon]|nr:hypothetical protein [archaeon]
MNLEERLSRCLDNIMARNDDIKQMIRNKTRSSGNILQYDKKVSSKLKEIIDISQSRFRLVKMGNSVESILNNSPKIPKLSSEILNSPIQENLETIDKTKNILKKKFASNFSLRSNFQFKHLNEKEGEEENKKEKGINEYNRKKNLERFQYILEQKLNKEQKDLNENITKHLKKTNSMIIKYTDLFKKAG